MLGNENTKFLICSQLQWLPVECFLAERVRARARRVLSYRQADGQKDWDAWQAHECMFLFYILNFPFLFQMALCHIVLRHNVNDI